MADGGGAAEEPVSFENLLEQPAEDFIFFKVIVARPRAAKVIPSAPAAGSRMGVFDMAVTLHSPQPGSTLKEARVSLTPSRVADAPGQSPLLVLSHLGCTFNRPEYLAASCVEYVSRSAPLTYQIAGLGESENHLLGLMVAKDAFEEHGRSFQIADIHLDLCTAAVQLKEKGFVCEGEEPNDGLRDWSITERGVLSLEILLKLPEPSLAFKAGTALAIQDRTSWQLILSLKANGWTWANKPSRIKPPAFTPGGAKVWYTNQSSNTVNSSYLRALAWVDQATGDEEALCLPVEHCRILSFVLVVCLCIRYSLLPCGCCDHICLNGFQAYSHVGFMPASCYSTVLFCIKHGMLHAQG